MKVDNIVILACNPTLYCVQNLEDANIKIIVDLMICKIYTLWHTIYKDYL